MLGGANGYIGDLDAPSSEAARRFLAENPEFKDFCPAYIVEPEDWSGGYIIQVGINQHRDDQ